MQSCTRYVEGKKFETFLGPHRIVTDQPGADGRTASGPTPPELLLACLGACAGHYAAEYLKTRSLPASGLGVNVTAEKGGHPVRLSAFRVEVDLPGELQPQHQQGLLRAVKSCLIHNTLAVGHEVEIDVCRPRAN